MGRVVAVASFAEGYFSITLRPGKYKLLVRASGDRAPPYWVLLVAHRTRHVRVQINVR